MSDRNSGATTPLLVMVFILLVASYPSMFVYTYDRPVSYEYDEAAIQGQSETYPLPVGKVRLQPGELEQFEYTVTHVGDAPLDVEVRFDIEQLLVEPLPEAEASYVEIYVDKFERWRSLTDVADTPIFEGEVLPGRTYEYEFKLRLNEAATDAWSKVTFSPQLLSTVSKQS